MTIEIDIPKQELRSAGENTWFRLRSSASARRTGASARARCAHRAGKIGAGLPLGAVFSCAGVPPARWTPGDARALPGSRLITRILWLSGCEPGKNRLGDVDTMRRYIYIHGCPDMAELGKPGRSAAFACETAMWPSSSTSCPYTPVEIRPEASRGWGEDYSFSQMMPVMSPRDVERRLRTATPSGAQRLAVTGDLRRRTLLDRNMRAVGDAGIEGGERGGDVERYAASASRA